MVRIGARGGGSVPPTFQGLTPERATLPIDAKTNDGSSRRAHDARTTIELVHRRARWRSRARNLTLAVPGGHPIHHGTRCCGGIWVESLGLAGGFECGEPDDRVSGSCRAREYRAVSSPHGDCRSCWRRGKRKRDLRADVAAGCVRLRDTSPDVLRKGRVPQREPCSGWSGPDERSAPRRTTRQRACGASGDKLRSRCHLRSNLTHVR
jgi:hypothetical protein